MGRARLPWKRGPIAWRIKRRADAVRQRLASLPQRYLSLRQTARLLGVSTQPVRDWLRLGHLICDKRTSKISHAELERFLAWLSIRAEPYEPHNYTERFIRKTKRYPFPFQKLSNARFHWPKDRKALSPKELAALVGCHPSLIVKAINYRQWSRLGRRRTRCRWEITKSAWSNVYYGTIIVQKRLPALPNVPLFSTRAAAEVMGRWGMPNMSVTRVRQMLRTGELEAIPPGANSGRWQVPRKSLEKVRQTLLTR